MGRPNCCRSWRTTSRGRAPPGRGRWPRPRCRGVRSPARTGRSTCPGPRRPTSRPASTSAPSKLTWRDGVAVQAHLALGRAERDAVGVGRDDEAGQALARVLAGAHERRVEVGVARVRDPRLGALEPVRRAVRLGGGPGGDRGDVRAGLGLRQAVGAELVAAEHARQQGRLLLVGAELRHGVAGERVHARRRPRRSSRPTRSPPRPAGRPRRAGRHRRAPRRRAATAARTCPAGRRCRGGTPRRPRRRRPWGPAARSRSRGSGR